MAEIKYAEARAAIERLVLSRAKPAIERRSPAEALGQIVAETVRSPVSIPQYDNSAVDGFAFQSRDFHGEFAGDAPKFARKYSVLGSIIAGHTPPTHVPEDVGHYAWEIMTGAPFPAGYDCSVKIEDTEVIRDAKGQAREVVIRKAPVKEENLRGAGEDFREGDGVLGIGERIGPEQILGLEALGIAEVQVFRRPRVAVISTGGELCAPGEAPREGQIRNSTAPFLRAALTEMGADPMLYGTVGDRPAEYYALLQKVIATKPDVIISTGAVSMGIHDYVSSVVADLGGRVEFHRVSIRPGKPILMAELPDGGPVFFGLPGNPVSTVVGLRFFIDPYLRAWQGRPAEKPVWARLHATARKPEGLRCFFKAQLTMDQGEPRATLLAGQPSFMISPLLHSTAWGILPEPGREIAAGDWIEIFPFYSSAHPWGAGPGVTREAPPHAKEGCCT